ncbi:MAG: hypothetical protein K9N46_12375 [Candidatus Marinimicrobia bacterium]|nr:hypothetical protein [Candidatus Neomarinimicrobiota bacterium]MCF7829074.1 hypothetical protein [Candidatus Neomarinimicrobiota bacterium]MCF7881527.1 hypothetical protein [Candidatus Neomarinimicrobiota bacterium]
MTLRTQFRIYALTFLSIFIVTCGDKRPLPTGPVDSGRNVAAGDTIYTRVKPDWPAENGFSLNDPRDICVNRDGYVFVADRGNSRVLVMNKTGRVIESADAFGNKNFDDLAAIPSWENSSEVIQPMGISADARMNIFIVDSTNHVYVWNQYVNNVGVEAVASGFILEDNPNQTISAEQFYRMGAPVQDIEGVAWSSEQARIDSLLKPRMFFSTSVAHMISGRYGNAPEESRFNAVAAWMPQNIASPSRDGSVYLTDASFYSRIVRVDYQRYRMVRLTNGQTIWLHRGKFQSFAVSKGTGQGTVMSPTGLYFQQFNQDPKLLYSQTDKNFGAHRVSLTTGEFDLIQTADIGEIGRFQNARDIAADENGNIYVTNTGKNYVEEFSPKGNFLRYLGTEEVRIDTTVTDTLISGGDTSYVDVDSTFIRYEPNVLQRPSAVAVSDGEVYIADPGEGRIVRYKLSTDVDINRGERE